MAQYAIHGLVRQYNIHRDPNHMIICYLSCALCICMRYLLSFILINILTLQKVLMIYEIEEEPDFLTAACVYEHFDAVVS